MTAADQMRALAAIRHAKDMAAEHAWTDTSGQVTHVRTAKWADLCAQIEAEFAAVRAALPDQEQG